MEGVEEARRRRGKRACVVLATTTNGLGVDSVWNPLCCITENPKGARRNPVLPANSEPRREAQVGTEAVAAQKRVHSQRCGSSAQLRVRRGWMQNKEGVDAPAAAELLSGKRLCPPLWLKMVADSYKQIN